MKAIHAALLLCGVLPVAAARAQPAPASAPVAAPTAAPPCTPSATITPICGIAAPEDIELTPDGRHLLVSETGGFLPADGPQHRGLTLVDRASGAIQRLEPTVRPAAGWGDPECAAPAALAPHGIHLSRRPDGRWQVLVVNHAGRESIEFYELLRAGTDYSLQWHGCVVQPDGIGFNDVAAMPTGFVASIPLAEHPAPGKMPRLDGSVTGYLVEWTARGGLRRLRGSDAPYNNGVEFVPGNWRYVYLNAWTSREVRKYDRLTGKTVGAVKVAFMPDNLTVRADGKLIAAGVTELSPLTVCHQAKNIYCPVGFGTAVIDPKTMRTSDLYSGGPGKVFGASVALQAGNTLYIGTLAGDRIVAVKR